jgi:hypothetical protein
VAAGVLGPAGAVTDFAAVCPTGFAGEEEAQDRLAVRGSRCGSGSDEVGVFRSAGDGGRALTGSCGSRPRRRVTGWPQSSCGWALHAGVSRNERGGVVHSGGIPQTS